jgi:hypothetical protein
MTKLKTAKELRDDELLALVRDDTSIGKDFDTGDPEWHTPGHVNTYMIDCLRWYEGHGKFDEELWESFLEDFEGWTEELFALGNKSIRTTLRDYLRDNGVCAGGTRYVSQQLFNLLQQDKYLEWPQEEIAKQMKTGREFKSWQNPSFRAKIEAGNFEDQVKEPPQPLNTTQQPQQQKQTSATTNLIAATRGSHEAKQDFASFNQTPPFPPTQGQTSKPNPTFFNQPPPFPPPPQGETSRSDPTSFNQFNQTQPIPPTQDLTIKALTDLGKLYNSEDLKFGGEMYDVLGAKLKIFNEKCRRSGIQPHQYHEAFSTMLKGRALQFYYNHLAERGMKIDEMIGRTKAFFHTTENHQLYLQEWRATTFSYIIEKNPDNDLSQNLELLIDKLQKVQMGLSVDYQGDYNLRDQLVSACQGIPACKMVLLKPPDTFESVASELRNAIGVEMRCQNQVPQQYLAGNNGSHYDEHGEDTANGQFWVDRRYEGGGKSRGRGFPRGARNNGSRRGGGFGGSQDKKCFVCGKVGCWSTKHPASERKPRQDGWRQYAQEKGLGSSAPDFAAFLMDFEGIDTGEWDNNDTAADFNAWYTEAKNHDEPATQLHTQYMTSYGTVDGSSTVALLNEQAALHGFTKWDVFNQEPLERADQFYFRDRYSSETFQGILPDTGAAGVSTAGENQVIALQRVDSSVTLNTSTAGGHRIRFGDNPEVVSIGTVAVCTPFGTVDFQVLPTNTPFLFCLRDMDKHHVYLNNVRNILVHGDKEYPVVRKWGHPWLLYGEPEKSIAWCHLTETELRQLHRRFGHPAAERLYKVLTRAGHDDVDKAVIEKLTKFCHQCQMHGNAPGRFKFTLRDDLEFNYQVIVDVMFIDGKPTLHVIDAATSFQAARFLRNMTAKETWDALRMAWIDTYLGPPDTLVSDAGTNFTSAEFKANARIMAIEVEEIPVESHNSIGKLERYHAPLRRAFHMIAEDLRGQGLSSDHILQMAVKAVNDTAGPDGLVPTLLVFGAYPRLTDMSPPSPSIAARAAAIRRAMAEVRKVRAKQQVDTALGMRNGPSTLETLNLPLQAEVKVWRENLGWKGPFVLLARDGETCTVDVDGKATNFRTVVVKPYYRDESTEIPADDDDEGDDAEDTRDADWTPDELQPVKKKRGRPVGSRNKPKDMNIDTAMMTSTMMSVAYLSTKEQTDYELSLRLRKEGKITTAGAPFEMSDKKEVDALIGAGVFAFEMFDPAKHGGTRIFKSRMVREVKGKATDTPYEKSRMVIQGHSDGDKDLILTQSPTIQRASQRIIMAIAPSLARNGMKLWLRDITQAYIQSSTVLQRTIFAHLPTEIAHLYPKGTIMVVIKPLYGIAEAGTHWWATYFNHHREKLGMETSTYDPCLLITKSPERFGIVGMQTDDTLILCDDEFNQLEEDELKKAKFTAKNKEQLTIDNPLLFNGGIFSEKANGSMKLCQKKQGEKLKLVSKNTTVSKQQYVEQRARGAYIASICQPEASFDMSVAAQHKDPGNDDITCLNKRLEWQMANLDRGLTYIPLDLHTTKLFVFVDGSFANNKDLSSQIGYEIFLANETTTEDTFTMEGNLIHWSSTKSKRVTRSVLASEIYAMVHGVDMGMATGTTFDMITTKLGIPKIPIIVCTDSFSLYECLVKLGTTKEKRLMIDIMSLRQSYERRELFEVRWIHGQDNPADAMTKGDANRALQTFIDKNRITMRIQGRVRRDE